MLGTMKRSNEATSNRRDFFRTLDDPQLVFDGTAWDRLKYQLDCPFHLQRLPEPTTLHTLDPKPHLAGTNMLRQNEKADPTQTSRWPASQKFGGILWANSAHGVSSAGCAGS
jgi:hypothetical protein